MLYPSYYLLETNATLIRADILNQGVRFDRSAASGLSVLANVLALIFFSLTVQFKAKVIIACTLAIAHARTSIEDSIHFAKYPLLL